MVRRWKNRVKAIGSVLPDAEVPAVTAAREGFSLTVEGAARRVDPPIAELSFTRSQRRTPSVFFQPFRRRRIAEGNV
jgi:hypothetical protein